MVFNVRNLMPKADFDECSPESGALTSNQLVSFNVGNDAGEDLKILTAMSAISFGWWRGMHNKLLIDSMTECGVDPDYFYVVDPTDRALCFNHHRKIKNMCDDPESATYKFLQHMGMTEDQIREYCETAHDSSSYTAVYKMEPNLGYSMDDFEGFVDALRNIIGETGSIKVLTKILRYDDDVADKAPVSAKEIMDYVGVRKGIQSTHLEEFTQSDMIGRHYRKPDCYARGAITFEIDGTRYEISKPAVYDPYTGEVLLNCGVPSAENWLSTALFSILCVNRDAIVFSNLQADGTFSDGGVICSEDIDIKFDLLKYENFSKGANILCYMCPDYVVQANGVPNKEVWDGQYENSFWYARDASHLDELIPEDPNYGFAPVIRKIDQKFYLAVNAGHYASPDEYIYLLSKYVWIGIEEDEDAWWESLLKAFLIIISIGLAAFTFAQGLGFTAILMNIFGIGLRVATSGSNNDTLPEVMEEEFSELLLLPERDSTLYDYGIITQQYDLVGSLGREIQESVSINLQEELYG